MYLSRICTKPICSLILWIVSFPRINCTKIIRIIHFIKIWINKPWIRSFPVLSYIWPTISITVFSIFILYCRVRSKSKNLISVRQSISVTILNVLWFRFRTILCLSIPFCLKIPYFVSVFQTVPISISCHGTICPCLILIFFTCFTVNTIRKYVT